MKLAAVAVAAVLATASVVAADSPALRALADVPKTGTATGTGPVEATNAQPAAGVPKDKKEWGWGGPWGWGAGGWGRPWGCGGGWGGGWGDGWGGAGCGGGWGW